MSRKPIGERAMTGAERVRRYRERLRNSRRKQTAPTPDPDPRIATLETELARAHQHHATLKRRNVELEVALGIRRKPRPKKPVDKLPPIGRYAMKLAKTLGELPTWAIQAKLNDVIKYRTTEGFGARDRARLVKALRETAERFNEFADRLEAFGEPGGPRYPGPF